MCIIRTRTQLFNTFTNHTLSLSLSHWCRIFVCTHTVSVSQWVAIFQRTKSSICHFTRIHLRKLCFVCSLKRMLWHEWLRSLLLLLSLFWLFASLIWFKFMPFNLSMAYGLRRTRPERRSNRHSRLKWLFVVCLFVGFFLLQSKESAKISIQSIISKWH